MTTLAAIGIVIFWINAEVAAFYHGRFTDVAFALNAAYAVLALMSACPAIFRVEVDLGLASVRRVVVAIAIAFVGTAEHALTTDARPLTELDIGAPAADSALAAVVVVFEEIDVTGKLGGVARGVGHRTGRIRAHGD